MQGLMGDCGAPGSAVCWKVRGCVGVCDGVVTVPAVARSRGGMSNTENQRLAEFCC